MREDELEPPNEGLVILAEMWELCTRNLKIFGILGGIGLLAGLAMLSRKEPMYRVEATILLDTNRGGGVLGELAALSSEPVAVSEMEILRSRSLAEEIVRAGDAESDGLTTLVESTRLGPLAGMLGGPGASDWVRLGQKPRLKARVSGDPGIPKQPVISAEFLSENVVVLTKRGALFGLGGAGSDPVEFTFKPGERIEYEGQDLWLYPQGDLTGERFWIRRLRFIDAVDRVMERTRISEATRNSGVVRVIHEDSDPERAAATTNALCSLYIQRNRERNEKRASQTVEFIGEQLQEQITALEQAELEVVALQRKNPHSVDIEATAQALVEQVASMRVEEYKLRMLLNGLKETLKRLNEGDENALSRLDASLTDPVTLNYVERIAQLKAESELLDRSDSGAFKGLVQSKRLELEAQRDAIGVEIVSLEGIMAALEAGEAGALGRMLTMEKTGVGDPLMRSYIERWSEHDARLKELEVEFTDELPEILFLRKQLVTLEEQVLSMFRGRRDGFQIQQEEYSELLRGYDSRVDGYPDVERLKIEAALVRLRKRTAEHLTGRMTGVFSRISKLKMEEVALESTLAELPEEVRQLADPLRRRESHAEIVKFLLARQKEAEINQASTVASAEFIDVAIPTRQPRGPFVPGFLLGGALFGLGIAFVLSFVRHSFDRSVYTTSDLETSAGVPLFGSIPDYRHGLCKVRGVAEDFMALRDDPEGPIAEAYRSLRSNLKFVLNTGQADVEIRTLGFTSCTQGEGKSITNTDMALAFAMTGKRVLLVDADMRRPSSNMYLRAAPTPGLSDILKGNLGWRECVQGEIYEGLDLIPAGPQPASPGDLLAGDMTGRFIQEVRDAYDIVVFDVPPVLAVADIDCLADKLDALLLVVRSGRLSNKVVAEGCRRLEQVGANLIGCVLNASRPRRREQKYGYGYGYGYGSDYKKVA